MTMPERRKTRRRIANRDFSALATSGRANKSHRVSFNFDENRRISPAEHERLSLLLEECGEVVQAIGKILRHGYESRHPDSNMDGPTNREMLARECGDIRHAMIRLCEARDLSKDDIHAHADRKAMTVQRYLHHQAKP